MDYKELISWLKNETYCLGRGGLYSRNTHPVICNEAATAITELLERVERAEDRCERLEEARENANEAARKWEYRAEIAEKRTDRLDAIKNILGDDYDLERLAELVKADSWISVEDDMPIEHDSLFKKFKGTDMWREDMFETCSDEVMVTLEFSDGTRKVSTAHTYDGKWKWLPIINPPTVTHWKPFPAPAKSR